ncbi:Hypothetical predicted protein, partial [Paramuricea clavata]
MTITSVQTAVIEPTTPSSEPTLQMTEQPTIPLSINNETQPREMTEKIPSTVAPVASTKPPCYDMWQVLYSVFRLLCDCAVKAQLQGYHYIGLQYYTECWTSNELEPHYSRDGPSTDKCFNAEFQPCSQDDSDCVGGARANFIYKIVNPDKPATSEMKGTSSNSSAQEVLQPQATTEMKLPTTLPLTPTFQVTEPSEQPSSTPPLSTFHVTESTTYTPSTQEYIPSESTFQMPNKPSEQTEQPMQITISSVQTAVIEPTSPSSEPTLQMTEKPTIPLSINNETQPPEMTENIPSTVPPVASTTPPCYDEWQ